MNNSNFSGTDQINPSQQQPRVNLPQEPTVKGQLAYQLLCGVIVDKSTGDPFLPAIVVATAVINVIEAFKAELNNQPNKPATLKAFMDMMVGLETNIFYNTHKSTLWPVMNMILQATLDAVNIGANEPDPGRRSLHTKAVIDRANSVSYEIIPSILFAVGGMAAVREHSPRLRKAYFMDEDLQIHDNRGQSMSDPGVKTFVSEIPGKKSN